MIKQEVQETVLRLVRTADQLVHTEGIDTEGVKQRLKLVDEQSEKFIDRIDNRRKNITMALSFFKQTQTVSEHHFALG